MKRKITLLCLVLFSSIQAGAEPDASSQVKNKDTIQSTALTIYKDATLVEQTRTLTVDAGTNTYSLGQIPNSIYPESLMLSISSDDKNNAQVLEYVVSEEENSEMQLKLLLDSKVSNRSYVRLLYLFKNLEWNIDYVLHFSPNYEEVYLNGWIQISNKSTVSFSKAQVQFVDSGVPAYSSSASTALEPDEKSKQCTSDSSSSSSYPHAYVYVPAIDIPAMRSKRIAWVHSQHVKAKQDYRIFVGGNYLNDMEGKSSHPTVEAWISFENTNDNGMGQPLPSGVANLYRVDEKGKLEVLGKAPIPHTPVGHDVSVKIPPTQAESCSFSTGQEHMLKLFETELDQTEFKKLSDRITEGSYRLSLKNKSDRSITIRVTLDLPGSESIVIKENLSHQQNGDQQIFWTIQVDANTDVDLKYRVRLIKD